MTLKKKLIVGSVIVVLINVIVVGLCIFYAYTTLPEFSSNYVESGSSLSQLTSKTTNILILFFICILTSIVIFVIAMVSTLIRSVLNPLKSLRDITKAVGDGDLNYEIKYNSSDEIGSIIKEISMVKNIAIDYSKEKLRLENQRKVMIASIAHDLKTPLTSINGYIDGLIDGVANTPEKQERYLKTIKSKTKDLNKLVDDLFLFSKLDLGSVPFDLKKIDYCNFAENIFNQINQEKDEIAITIESEIKNKLLVLLDENQFKRVFTNIIENSIKYKKNDIVNIKVSFKQNLEYIVTKISDDGKGIEESAVENIFQRFYRSDEARTNPSGGSGLGLSITKHIVEKSKGKIWAKSILGEGTSIYISLPIAGDEEKL